MILTQVQRKARQKRHITRSPSYHIRTRRAILGLACNLIESIRVTDQGFGPLTSQVISLCFERCSDVSAQSRSDQEAAD